MNPDPAGHDLHAHYLRYEALTRVLQTWATDHPELVTLESLGHSHEGREIWLVTVTDRADGRAPEDKPAIWVDGTIHATELAPTHACLALVEHLLGGHAAGDADVARALRTRTFYICPRINPDGAEWALADSPRYLRSSTRAWPPERRPGGLRVEDVDGDGRVLTMRIPDPDGAWKICPEEPRLVVRRGPAEFDTGPYYRLMPEGRVQPPSAAEPVADPRLVALEAQAHALDLNRNFPAQWRVEAEQAGAGPYPASEPEVRAVVDFIASHPNITAGVAFHTTGGLLMRPFSHRPDSDFPTADLRTWQLLGERGTQLTGYPTVSVYHGFRDDPQTWLTGAIDDWLYEHLGVFGWTVEIWSAPREAGVEIPGDDVLGWYREHPVADDLAMLRWSDETLGGAGYVDWYPFEHPELGAVELGGWHDLMTLRNPPPSALAREVARFPQWLVFHAMIAPELAIVDVSARALDAAGTLFEVRAIVANRGWLPTSVTQWAEDRSLVRGVRCRLVLPDDGSAVVVSGSHEQTFGQLAGRSRTPSAPLWRSADESHDRLQAVWVVRREAAGGVELVVEASHPRAGRQVSGVRLQGSGEALPHLKAGT